MASAYRKRKGWAISFRNVAGKRVAKVVSREFAGKPDADRYARRVDDACRDVELCRDPNAVRFLVQEGVMSPEQADNTLAGQPILEGAVTIARAWMMHPAAQRENAKTARDAMYHRKAVDRFCEFAGVSGIADVSLALVMRWVAEMQARGWAYDTRRHHLLPIRQACAMAPTLGIPDVLAGFAVDRRERTAPIAVLSASDLRELLHGLETGLSRYCAVALMGACGLRPSEVIRLRVCDWREGTLSVGSGTAKTDASRRELPVPAVVARQIDRMAARKPADGFLVTGPEMGPAALDARNLARMLQGFLPVSPKVLRKSFATACIREFGIAPALVEDYLGHKQSGVLAVTSRHYLAGARASALTPVSETWDRFLSSPIVYR